MRPAIKRTLKEVAEAENVPFDKMLGHQRLARLVRARILAARRLRQEGYPISLIASSMGRDHSSIAYYLQKPLVKLKWKPPVVELLCYVTPKPAKVRKISVKPLVRRQYLIPYVGADMTQYVWKRRPSP